jgi:hypothetical protein
MVQHDTVRACHISSPEKYDLLVRGELAGEASRESCLPGASVADQQDCAVREGRGQIAHLPRNVETIGDR